MENFPKLFPKIVEGAWIHVSWPNLMKIGRCVKCRLGIINLDFRPISRFISETIQDMVVVTMELE